MAEPQRLHPRGEEPIGALIKNLVTDVRDLVRDEIRLARAETSETVSNSVSAGATLTIGGTLAFLGLAYVLLAIVFALSNVVTPWAASLIVGGIVLVFGGILMLIAWNALKRVRFIPERTIDTLKED